MPSIHLKYVLIAITIIGLIIGAKVYVSSLENAAYDRGVEATTKAYKAQVEENDRHNREVEAQAQARVDAITEKLERRIAELGERTQAATETVTRIIERTPELEQCEIPQEIIDARNRLRVGK